MQDTLLNLLHSLSLILVSGFHASELLVTFVVALAFLAMAAMGREHDKAETASVDEHRADWLPRPR
jgi:hypothetical protein